MKNYTYERLKAMVIWEEARNRFRLDVSNGDERKSFYCSVAGPKGKKQVIERAMKWLSTGVIPTSIRFSEAWDRYIEELKASMPFSTYHPAESFGNRRIKPIVGTIKMSDIGDADVINILKSASSLKRKTLQDIKSELGKFFDWCYIHNISSYEMSRRVKIPGNAMGAIPSARNIALGASDFQKLFDSENDSVDEYIDLFRYMILTGLRPSEAIALSVSSISEDYSRTNVTSAINEHRDTTHGKNASAIRTVYNCRLAREILQRRVEGILGVNGDPSTSLFGCGVQRTLRDHFDKICSSIGITRITPYACRHSFLSYVETAKYHFSALNPSVGHVSEIQSYIHTFEGSEKPFINGLDAFFDYLLAYNG